MRLGGGSALFAAVVQCEPPNSAIYKFNGQLSWDDGRKESASKDNLLLRGCELRNTDFIEGLVVYAGHDTKVPFPTSPFAPKERIVLRR